MDAKGPMLVGAGFLLGTVGVAALTSETARKCYVQGVACGLRARNAYQDIVEEAKAEVDDIVAEATYLAETEEEEEAEEAEEEAPKADAKPAAKTASKPAAKATRKPATKATK